MFKTLANRSRRVRDACEDFAIPCERFAILRRFGKSIRKPIAYSSHPSEIGALAAANHYKRILIPQDARLEANVTCCGSSSLYLKHCGK